MLWGFSLSSHSQAVASLSWLNELLVLGCAWDRDGNSQEGQNSRPESPQLCRQVLLAPSGYLCVTSYAQPISRR